MNKWNENSARWHIKRLVSWLEFNGTFSINMPYCAIDISKIWYRYIKNFDISAGDTIRYIDIASVFQYFGYIEATLQCMTNTLRKPYCKTVQTELHAPPTSSPRRPTNSSSPPHIQKQCTTQRTSRGLLSLSLNTKVFWLYLGGGPPSLSLALWRQYFREAKRSAAVMTAMIYDSHTVTCDCTDEPLKLSFLILIDDLKLPLLTHKYVEI